MTHRPTSFGAISALSAANGDDAAFVAVDEHGQIVGCMGLHALTMFHLAGRLGRMTALVVENVRGSGVGRALMAAAHAWNSTSEGLKKTARDSK